MSDKATTDNNRSSLRRTSQAARSGLDVMLGEAAVGGPPRFLAPGAGAKVGAGLARHPGRAAARAGGLTAELARAALGRSERVPAKGDRRFADPAWEGNWLLRRVLQAYLAVGETVDGLITDAEVDWRAERRARLAAGNVLDALAPSNFAWSNPTVLKEIVNTGGGNLVRGTRQFVHDLGGPSRMPATVDTSGFEVGGNLAASPGSVVLRTEVFELIQYKPSTDQVRETPLLFIPPTINKFYVFDLSPGRSMIEHYVAEGQQVFGISWRNPGQEQGDFDLDTYAAAVAEARDAVAAITGDGPVHLAAACSGGIITAGLLGHLAVTGDLGDVASLTLMVCALDNDTEGTVSALTSRDVAAAAVAESARRGYVDGQALAGVFTWLRPNDLVWNYVVNNYLLGKAPPSRLVFTVTSSTSRWTIRSSTRARSMSSARRWTWARLTWTRTSLPARVTTSSPGRAHTSARSCLEASDGSSSPGAVTFRRSSILRVRTAARASVSPMSFPAPPMSSSPAPRGYRAAGGRTGTPGWPSVRVS
jgi:polyhydroxyalkanoate synthase